LLSASGHVAIIYAAVIDRTTLSSVAGRIRVVSKEWVLVYHLLPLMGYLDAYVLHIEEQRSS
jgi:hypothetical protein